MRILFNLLTTIEVPDADVFPPREKVEKELVEFFANEGIITRGLNIMNYRVIEDEQESE